jgi:transketolase
MYRQMRYDPRDPWNPASDRLVLSLGHAVPVVYAAYADLGGAVGNDPPNRRILTVEDLDSLRELESVLDGHPNPAEGFPFFDAATGSLGQGLSVAGGLALAARLDGIDKRIYCIIGDGESREGQVWEAVDFIADYKLANVCAVFSCNGHGQAGLVSAQQSADAIARKMEAFGWDVFDADGHDPEDLHRAFQTASQAARPAAIVARTVKGWGVELTIGKNYHGKPLSAEELPIGLSQLDQTAKRLSAGGSIPRPSVTIPAAPKTGPRGEIRLPDFEVALRNVGLQGALEKKKLATRNAYGAALVALGAVDGRVVSLDGDVSNSTFANMFAKAHPERFFECKIAEQSMVSAAAGLAAAGKIPFASSFGKFIARATDQIDMAVISRANIKIVGSHTGVSLGADGPSQMAMADVAYFRSMTRVDAGRGIPACHVFHPSDAISAYRCVELMANLQGLCYLRTHRPDAPFLYSFDEQFGLGGCKLLRSGRHLTLAGCGFMLHTMLAAAKKLAERGIECNVFDAYTFPLDTGPILSAAREAGGLILVVEDNFIGGLHSELAEAAAETGDIRVFGLTVNRLPKSAKSAEEVFEYTGVGLGHIVDRAVQLAAR